MKKVVFVGDAPSNTNVSTKLAFVGAKCFPKLVEWIRYISPDYYICVNSSPSELTLAAKLFADDFKVIALGRAAAKRLVEFEIPHYELPHPSGRNHKTNDETLVAEWLDLAKTYVEAGLEAA